ncbi:MAG TPA: hypothetical protein GXX19_05730 [Syntrophomonadaceae bacterium]|nr:hypothetical protein [Syntrophomonadaceae bacterium]
MPRCDSILAVLSGFEPNNTPDVGTFYDFLNRFWLEDDDVQTQRRKRLVKPSRKPSKRLKPGEKLPVKHPGIVEKLVAYAVKGRDPFPLRAKRLIHLVFARCVVYRSLQLGLIPHPLDLVLAGDGTSVRTGASHYGARVCDCRKNGVLNCDCPLRFSDPQAR